MFFFPWNSVTRLNARVLLHHHRRHHHRQSFLLVMHRYQDFNFDTMSIFRKTKITLIASGHDMTRHAIQPMHFGTRKSRNVLCRTCRTARRDTFVASSATGATRTTRVQGRRHSVDQGGHVHLTFSRIVPEIDANSEQKRLNFYTRALVLLLFRHPPCWNEHGAIRTTRETRSSRRPRHPNT